MKSIMHNGASSSSTDMHQRANTLHYSSNMHKEKQNVSETLIKNLKILMEDRGWKPKKLSDKSGVSPRMVAYILKGERVCSIEIAEQLANAFGLHGWELLIGDIPEHLLKSKKLEKLYKNYASATIEAQSYIDHIAEREAQYSTKKAS